ncbi:MAG TPA: hypothetical protein PLV83_05465 [Bacilli bacterium]|nr:hypothetical protein [Bacilli bacterium]
MKRKIYLFILTLLIGITTIGCQHAFVTVTGSSEQYLTFTFYENEYYDLETGLRYDSFTENTNNPYDVDYANGWSISDKVVLPNSDTITLDNLNFHYILYWRNSTFLGYYNVTSTNAVHYFATSLGQINSTTITPPSNATHFAIMANNLGVDTPYTLGYTFDDIFSSYNDSPIVSGDWELWDLFDETQAIANNKYDYLDDTTELLPNAPLRNLTEFGIDIFINNRVMTVSGTATTESSENLYSTNLDADTFENHLSITVSLNSEFDTSDFIIYYVDNNGDYNDLQTFSDYTGENTYTYEITDGFRNIGIFYYEAESYGLQMAFSLNPYIPYNFVTDLDTAIYEGLSLRDIFEDGNLVVNGDFSDGTTGWSSTYSILTNVNNNLIITGNGSYSVMIVSQSLFTNSNDNIYYNLKMRVTNSDAINFTVRKSTSAFIAESYPIENQWYSFSGITIDNIVGEFVIRNDYASSAIQNNKVLEVDYAFGIPLSIFTIAPSQTQLDEWLDMYLTLKDGELLDIPENYVFYQTDEANLNGYKNVFLDLDRFDDVFSWNETTAKYYYDLFIDSIYFVPRYEFYTFENGATIDEFTDYYTEYGDLIVLTPIEYTTFADNEVSYYITLTTIDDVDNVINNFLADLGLGTFGNFLVLIVIIIAISVLLAVLHVPMIMILLVDLVLLLLSFLLGWIPSWVGILLVILLFAYLVLKLVGGKGGSD